MGRKKTNTAKTERIRITPKVRYDLYRIREELNLPSRYKEGDIIQAMVSIFDSSLSANET